MATTLTQSPPLCGLCERPVTHVVGWYTGIAYHPETGPDGKPASPNFTCLAIAVRKQRTTGMIPR